MAIFRIFSTTPRRFPPKVRVALWEGKSFTRSWRKTWCNSSGILGKKSRIFPCSFFSWDIFQSVTRISFLSSGIMFALVFPLVQSFAFFYSIGGDPKGFSLAVINDEAGNCNFGMNHGSVSYDPKEKSCKYVDMSCRFLHDLGDSLIGKVSKIAFPLRWEENSRVGRFWIVLRSRWEIFWGFCEEIRLNKKPQIIFEVLLIFWYFKDQLKIFIRCY